MSILEIFDRIRLPVFPDLANPFLLFLELTEGIGRYRLTLELHDLRDDVVIARVTTPSVEFTERLSKLRVTVPLSRLFLPHAGYYEVVALADGQELGRQKFSAIASEE